MSKKTVNVLIPILVLVLASSFLSCTQQKAHKAVAFYTACACADDEPQFIIKTIDGDTSDLQSEDLFVRFETPTLDSAFYTDISECAICYTCTFSGNLTFDNIDGFYTMVVQQYSIMLRPDCCDPE